MCEFSGRLIAWMDRELEQGEACNVERHVRKCIECRSCVAEFERVNGEFEEYCEAVLKSKERHGSMRWTPVLWGATAAAAAGLVALMLTHPRARVEQVPVPPPLVTGSLTSLAAKGMEGGLAPLTSHRRIHRRHGSDFGANSGAACCATTTPTEAESNPARTGKENVNWVADEPSVQIAIPAAAMFPPGAVPEGVTFVADLSIGPDGSARQVRLQPRISEFERRLSQP